MAEKTKRKWQSAKAMGEAVEAYLRDCAEQKRLPSVTGLALVLGFSGRQALERYTEQEAQGNEARLREAAVRAKARIEEETIQAACRRESASGARFLLQTGFGYTDKKEISQFSGTIQVNLTDGEEE